MALRRQRDYILAPVQIKEMAYDNYVFVVRGRLFNWFIHGDRSE